MPEQKLLPIGIDELGRFTVGEQDHALYLDGDKVQTAAVSLTRRQAKWAIAAAVAAIVGVLASVTYTTVYVWSTFHKSPAATGLVCRPDHVSRQSLALTMVGCVGPFISGKSELLDLQPHLENNCTDIDGIKTEINRKKTSPIFLAFVGTTDKFLPSSFVRQLYGSNAGLAQARANWVIRQSGLDLTPASGNKIAVLSLIRGPSVSGLNVSASESAPDRSVAVYGLWSTEASVVSVVQ